MGIDVEQHEGTARPRGNIVFYYDFASPESYIALERLAKTIAAFAPELVPVREAELDPLPWPDDDARRQNIEAIAEESDVLPLVWPADFPYLETSDAVRVATYAKSIGKIAVFSLSLFRQIYAAGNDPADVTTLYLAAAASEIHPRAVDQALSRDRVQETADEATEAARAAGVTSVPALRIGQKLLVGPALMADAHGVMRDAIETFKDA